MQYTENQNLLHILNGVLETILSLQFLDGRLAVLDEAGCVDGSTVVVLLVVLHDLLEKFRENAGKALDNDRILLSKVEAGN